MSQLESLITKYVSRLFWLMIFGCLCLIGTQARVMADVAVPAPSSLTVTFVCNDHSRDVTVGADSSKAKTLAVHCGSGEKINYKNPGGANVQSIKFSCASGQGAIFEPSTVNGLSSKLYLSCKKVIGHTSSGYKYSSGSVALPKASAPIIQNPKSDQNDSGDISQSHIQSGGLLSVPADQTTITKLLNIFFGVIGAIAVLVVSIGGLRYVLANGDANQIVQAKNTIIYALVGLVVAITGFSIVTFVIKRIT